jgi:ubiquinone/menaquinone biosynthesis C-methylase UbiE
MLSGLPCGVIYGSRRMAAGYAFDRPPVHQHVLGRFARGRHFRRALDVGCGAGLSATALAPFADTVIAIEPVRAMLAYRVGRAHYVVAQGEQLPFAVGSFDLVTAAGAVNYMDRPRFIAEAERVLRPNGTLLVYDFDQGRSSLKDDRLAGSTRSSGVTRRRRIMTSTSLFPWISTGTCAMP